MTIERLNKGQRDLIRELYQLCFSSDFDSDSFNAYLASDDLWEFVWGVVSDDMLLSSYVAYEGGVKIRTVPFQVFYFDGFVTRPGYRNKGMGQKMFEHQRKVAEKKSIYLFALDPFKNSYYKQFGFEDALDLLKIEIPMRNLSWEKVDDLYQTNTSGAFQSQKAMQALHEIDEREWEEGSYNPMRLPNAYFYGMFNQKSWKVCLLTDEFEKYCGCLLYEIKDRKMTVYKMSFFDLKGIYTFRNWFSQFRDQIDTIFFFKAPRDFPIEVLAETFHSGSSHVNMRIYPTRMMQILDIQYAIQNLLPVLNLPVEPVVIQFTDEQINTNNQILSISKRGVKPVKKSIVDLVISVPDFVPIFTGRLSVSDQFRRGKVKIPSHSNPSWNPLFHPDIIQRMNGIFPRISTHNNEFCF